MGKSQRNKGAGYEREVCGLLNATFGTEVSRVLGQARDGGGDIHLGNFLIECKRRKAMKTLYGWMAQATKSAHESGLPIPVVMLRADGENTLVVIRLVDWMLTLDRKWVQE